MKLDDMGEIHNENFTNMDDKLINKNDHCVSEAHITAFLSFTNLPT